MMPTRQIVRTDIVRRLPDDERALVEQWGGQEPHGDTLYPAAT
jgi:hypothetical protein